jgi:hypothetical protein
MDEDVLRWEEVLQEREDDDNGEDEDEDEDETDNGEFGEPQDDTH